jgi:hypothetical protein
VPLALALVVFVSGCTVGVTHRATGVGETAATLRGQVFATAAGDVDYWFRYGETTEYGQTTPRRTIAVSGEDDYPVSEPVAGLSPDTEYHFQLCTQHHTDQPDHVACISDLSFRTDIGPPTALSIGAEPNLYPSFTAAASDYVARCDDDPVTMDVAAPAGTQVSVNGGPARTGNFSQAVPLAEGEAFDFTVTGQSAGTYHVRCLPTDFPTWTFSRTGGPPTQAWTLLALSKGTGRYVTFIDANGTPVWWLAHERTPLDASLMPDDTVAFARGEATPFGRDDTAYEIYALDGTLLRTLVTVGADTDHHDFRRLANGNYLLMTYKPRDHVDLSAHGGPADATVLDAEIQEITPAGALVWSWNSKDHIALGETAPWWQVVRTAPAQLGDGRSAYDIVHINAFEPDGDSLLVSMRHTDAIYRIRRSDGAVLWKLGGTTTPQRLTVGSDPRTPTFSGQHDVHRLVDGTVTVYDNGTQAGRPPRAVRFSINAAAGTATWLEAVSDPLVTTSACCGSSRKLASGGWLVGWGSIVSPVIGEYAANGTALYRLRYPDAFSYRAFPVPPGRITAQELRDGMDAMASG